MSRVDDAASAPRADGTRIERGGRAGRYVRFLLPAPTSERHAVSVLVLGFAVEGGTELYQFLQRASLGQGALEYYTTLATTIFGFYLMFLGMREWYSFHPRRGGASGSAPMYSAPRFRLALWVGGTAAAAALAIGLGPAPTGSAPFWIAWPFAGLIVLAFGDFFFGLRVQAHRLGSSLGNSLGWLGFGWSLAVATVAGLVVGERIVTLLTDFVSNWVLLIAAFAPIVIAMSPLFVAYGLMSGAFSPALHAAGRARADTPPHPVPARTPPDPPRAA